MILIIRGPSRRLVTFRLRPRPFHSLFVCSSSVALASEKNSTAPATPHSSIWLGEYKKGKDFGGMAEEEMDKNNER